MGTQGTGRKRSTKKERSTAEDDALNLIAREVSEKFSYTSSVLLFGLNRLQEGSLKWSSRLTSTAQY